jgi:type IV pilus assembly protein PilN
MKFRINLASQPYENARRFYLRWGAALIVLAIVTGALVYGAVGGWRNVNTTSARIAAEKANLDKLKQLEQQDLAILNKPENRDVRDRSLVLNGLIRRKEFSWTLIFADLEHIMPARLHVVSINPQIDKNNDITVKMIVAGDSREKAVELIQNMEKSREFRGARVLSENETRREQGGAQQSTDTVRFEIAAYYVPVVPTTPSAQERSGQ